MNQNFESVLRDNSYTVTKICCPAENDDQKRYFLGKSGTKVIIVIGLNPSIADRNIYDNTVMKIEQIVHQQGDKYDGFIVFNLSA